MDNGGHVNDIGPRIEVPQDRSNNFYLILIKNKNEKMRLWPWAIAGVACCAW